MTLDDKAREELTELLKNQFGLWIGTYENDRFWGMTADALIPFIERAKAEGYEAGYSEAEDKHLASLNRLSAIEKGNTP